MNTATTLTNSRLGAITGSGNNTLLGFFKGLLSKVAPVPSDIGGTFDSTTDSIEAIRDRGDVAWTTGAGGGGGSVNTSIILNATDALLSAGITPLEIVGASGKIINVQILSGGPVYFANSSGVISAVTVPAKEISKEDKIVKLNFADRAWYFTLSGTARFTYTIEN